ncbi:MAG: hypothetical protein GX593_00095 [Actinomycetales bacterium]|nr:hypothetical protein [Actinomycetales bacterium]
MGTVLAIALAGVVVLVGLVLAGVGAGVTARAGAQSAADLAALAAGDVLGLELVLSGESSGDLSGSVGPAVCERAREVAVRNGAVLEACEPQRDAVVVVRVSRRTPWGPASATARAGPSATP